MMDSKELAQQLARFEEQIDKSDPEQLKLLDEMKEHTRRLLLSQARSDWNVASMDRSWNNPNPSSTTQPPQAINSYKAYKQLKDKEHKTKNQLLLNHTSQQSTSSYPQIE